jgi:pyrophosphatase PpaX
MKISTVIFDVDGVLIDSNRIIIEAYKKTARKLGLRVPSTQEISELLGKPLEKIIKLLWPNADADLYTKEYREFFMDEKLKIPAIDGAVETVRRMKSLGFKLGLLSGKISFFIKKHLEETGFDLGWFDVIVSFEVTKKHKPDPEPLLYILDKLRVKPEEVLYVGDSKFDYECAKNAGVNYVAVLTGCLGEKELKGIGVKNIINSVVNLPEFLELE